MRDLADLSRGEGDGLEPGRLLLGEERGRTPDPVCDLPRASDPISLGSHVPRPYQVNSVNMDAAANIAVASIQRLENRLASPRGRGEVDSASASVDVVVRRNDLFEWSTPHWAVGAPHPPAPSNGATTATPGMTNQATAKMSNPTPASAYT